MRHEDARIAEVRKCSRHALALLAFHDAGVGTLRALPRGALSRPDENLHKLAILSCTPRPGHRRQGFPFARDASRRARNQPRWRYSRGGTPATRWKSTEKWLWLLQPIASAISVMVRSELSRSSFARSTRRLST